jgi:class I fructose-bisphosphate aldolase
VGARAQGTERVLDVRATEYHQRAAILIGSSDDVDAGRGLLPAAGLTAALPATRKDNTMGTRVKEILSWYASENPGVRTNLARMLNHGTLAGTGRMVILPVDQGFEHGPARSFAVNPAGYDRCITISSLSMRDVKRMRRRSASSKAGAAEFAGDIPLILKMNNHDVLNDEKDPLSAVTASVKDAQRLGCVAAGFTIYPGSANAQAMYQQCREMIAEARDAGLASVVWSYPRGSSLSKEGETALDVVAYAAQIAAQLGAHIIKVKPPTAHIEQAEAKKAYDKAGVPMSTLAERVRHVVQSSFDGKRIVIFSGGATRDDDNLLFDEYRQLRDGGAFGSIIGRNSFQRKREHALAFLGTVMKIYSGELK